VKDLVTRYNEAELQARATVSNRAIEAFALEVFSVLGYPFRVDSEAELWRYHDVMQEGRFERNLHLIQDSEHDFDLVRKTAKQILDFSEHCLPFRSCGKHALTRSLYQFQLIIKNRPHDGKLKILEIGPGSGYLGILLANDGHEYFAMDAAQAFYLYQKKIWSHIFQSEYFDFSESTSRPTNPRITHLPWWRFANLSIALPEIDIVTVNHALTEMHENAVKLIFSRLHGQWGDNPLKIVLAEKLGYDYFKRKDEMFASIQELGFSFNQPQAEVYIWVPDSDAAQRQLTDAAQRQVTETKLQTSFRSQIKTKIFKKFNKLIARLLKTSVGRQLAKMIGRGPLKKSEQTTELSLQIRNLRTFLDELVPGELTPDENFLKYLDQKTF